MNKQSEQKYEQSVPKEDEQSFWTNLWTINYNRNIKNEKKQTLTINLIRNINNQLEQKTQQSILNEDINNQREQKYQHINWIKT